jgi:hypothetical protein
MPRRAFGRRRRVRGQCADASRRTQGGGLANGGAGDRRWPGHADRAREPVAGDRRCRAYGGAQLLDFRLRLLIRLHEAGAIPASSLREDRMDACSNAPERSRTSTSLKSSQGPQPCCSGSSEVLYGSIKPSQVRSVRSLSLKLGPRMGPWGRCESRRARRTTRCWTTARSRSPIVDPITMARFAFASRRWYKGVATRSLRRSAEASGPV